MAIRNHLQPGCRNNSIVGVLPMAHLKHFIFGNSLISIPFFDIGGILANDEETEETIISEAIKLGKELNVDNIELRHINPLLCDSSKDHNVLPINFQQSAGSFVTRSHKVRMLLELPESSAILMKTFGSKLRSQIKKPMKEGLCPKIGRMELIEDFYKVFLANMRDLGSPVHSKKIIRNVLEEFPETARITVVYKKNKPLAGSVIVGFKDTLENPWAASLREYSRLSPNMLLYWTMIEYACDNGFTYFDFGRSSPDEGTFKFKKQWGATPIPLHWHYIFFGKQPVDDETSEKSRFDNAIQYWKKLPVPITKVLGPMIRKHIGL